MGLGCSNNNFIKISAYRAKPGTTSMLAPATEDHGSEEETYVGKAAEKAAGDGDITHSRRTMRNGPPPPLPKARARAGHRKKKPTHVRLSSVTEAASSNTDSHHIEESDPTKRFQYRHVQVSQPVNVKNKKQMGNFPLQEIRQGQMGRESGNESDGGAGQRDWIRNEHHAPRHWDTRSQ